MGGGDDGELRTHGLVSAKAFVATVFRSDIPGMGEDVLVVVLKSWDAGMISTRGGDRVS